MKLIRLVNTTFSPSTQGGINMKIGSVNVKTLVMWNLEKEKKTRYSLCGSIVLSKELEITSENKVIIPGEKRKEIEKAIEIAVNLFAVASGSSRTLSSTSPYIALCHENDEEKNKLEILNGIDLEPIAIPGATFNFNLDDDQISLLQDRTDGVALLAEALSHSHPTGKFHEFLRLFERGFSKTSSGLVKPLSKFLSGNNQGYSKEEILNWVVTLRHPTTHADIRDFFILEAGIRPVINRMEQAAYDVLFNKKEWRNSSPIRREVWSPVSGTSSDKMDVFIMKGKTQSLKFQSLDSFSSYPLDLSGSGNIREYLPKNCWFKSMNETRVGGKLTLIEKENNEDTGQQ